MDTDSQLIARAKQVAKSAAIKWAISPTTVLQDLKSPIEAAMESARIRYNPNNVKPLADLGESIFRNTRLTGKPVSSFMSWLMPRYGQLDTIQAARDALAHTLRTTPRPAREWAARDARKYLQPMYAELGAAAKPRLQFQRYGVPALAAAGVAGPLAYAGGKWQGQGEGAEDVRQQIDSAPILTRLQRALFPQKRIQQEPIQTPSYERFIG